MSPAGVYSSSLSGNASSTLPLPGGRPAVDRRDTDQILSYYQSPLADTDHTYQSHMEDRNSRNPRLHRQASSSACSSVSNYSEELSKASTANTSATRDETDGDQAPQRRPSRTKGGADKRRLAIVEMDYPSAVTDGTVDMDRSDTNRHPNQPTLLLKRGVTASNLGGLALVAPPDASPSTYNNLTPPSSAPPVPQRDTGHATNALQERPPLGKHQRSYSEAVPTGSTASISRKASRDVGIVGTAKSPRSKDSALPSLTSHTHGGSNLDRQDRQESPQDLQPIFQKPVSRSPSIIEQTSATHITATGSALSTSGSLVAPLLTPTLGKPKDVHEPVMGPVVVDLSEDAHSRHGTSTQTRGDHVPIVTSTSSAPLSLSNEPSEYLYYRPGVHATAGPLPPPPRHVPLPLDSVPPPRPPRFRSPSPVVSTLDWNAAKDALRLPGSVSEYLSRKAHTPQDVSSQVHKSPSVTPEDIKLETRSIETSDTHALKSNHIREGAFPSSSIDAIAEAVPESPATSKHKTDEKVIMQKELMESLMTDVGNAIKEVGMMDSDDCAHSVAPERLYEIQHEDQSMKDRKRSSWFSLTDSIRPTSPAATRNSDISRQSMTTQQNPGTFGKTKQTFSSGNRRSPSPQHQSLNYASKRFSSLPRAPSITSETPTYLSQDPPPVLPHKPWKRTIKSSWPHAMHFNEVFSKKTSLERMLFYAQKINELAKHECGLDDWILGMKQKMAGLTPTPRTTESNPATLFSASNPRHVSHGSIASEITFPRRPDAKVATDLSLRSSEDDGIAPTAPPPSLPYPQLPPAVVRPSSKPFSPFSAALASRSSTISSLGNTRAIGVGFFASIGRKASVKRDRAVPSPSSSSPTKLIGRQTPMPPTAPRFVNLTSIAPAVPGGPRAIPNRVQRSQSVMGQSYTESQGITGGGLSLHAPGQNVSPHRMSVKRRPSVPPASTSGNCQSHIPNFDEQVARLADLLPHADRAILAGYLRRAGQDILAIGQYLEDEKNGRLHLD